MRARTQKLLSFSIASDTDARCAFAHVHVLGEMSRAVELAGGLGKLSKVAREKVINRAISDALAENNLTKLEMQQWLQKQPVSSTIES